MPLVVAVVVIVIGRRYMQSISIQFFSALFVSFVFLLCCNLTISYTKVFGSVWDFYSLQFFLRLSFSWCRSCFSHLMWWNALHEPIFLNLPPLICVFHVPSPSLSFRLFFSGFRVFTFPCCCRVYGVCNAVEWVWGQAAFGMWFTALVARFASRAL